MNVTFLSQIQNTKQEKKDVYFNQIVLLTTKKNLFNKLKKKTLSMYYCKK
jgi:hypothetical protein